VAAPIARLRFDRLGRLRRGCLVRLRLVVESLELIVLHELEIPLP
jgi:hypothetical protein